MSRPWDFKPMDEPAAWNMAKYLPPEVKLTDEDVQRIAVAKGVNSITRAYMMGLMAGMRRR